MDAIGDMTDRHRLERPARIKLAEDVATGAAMQLADGIDRAGPARCQVGHVEWLVWVVHMLASHGQQRLQRDAQFVLGIALQVFAQQLRREAVEAGFDGRMGREQIARAGCVECHFEGHALPGHVAAGALQHGECGVAVVQVKHIGLQPGGFEQPPAADAQHQLLAQTHFVVAAVEFAGDQSRDGRVGRVVGVQQEQAVAADPGLPAAQPDLHAGQLDRETQCCSAGVEQRFDGHLPGVIDRVECLLATIRADALAKIAVLPEHAYCGYRHAEVVGGLELVAGDIAEPAGVDRQRLAEHVLHGEIGDSRELFAVTAVTVALAGEPGRPLQACLLSFDDALHQTMAFSALQQCLQLLFGHGAEHHAGIARELPQVVIDQLPQVIVLAGPADGLVKGELAQGFRGDGGAFGCRRHAGSLV